MTRLSLMLSEVWHGSASCYQKYDTSQPHVIRSMTQLSLMLSEVWHVSPSCYQKY